MVGGDATWKVEFLECLTTTSFWSADNSSIVSIRKVEMRATQRTTIIPRTFLFPMLFVYRCVSLLSLSSNPNQGLDLMNDTNQKIIFHYFATHFKIFSQRRSTNQVMSHLPSPKKRIIIWLDYKANIVTTNYYSKCFASSKWPSIVVESDIMPVCNLDYIILSSASLQWVHDGLWLPGTEFGPEGRPSPSSNRNHWRQSQRLTPTPHRGRKERSSGHIRLCKPR